MTPDSGNLLNLSEGNLKFAPSRLQAPGSCGGGPGPCQCLSPGPGQACIDYSEDPSPLKGGFTRPYRLSTSTSALAGCCVTGRLSACAHTQDRPAGSSASEGPGAPAQPTQSRNAARTSGKLTNGPPTGVHTGVKSKCDGSSIYCRIDNYTGDIFRYKPKLRTNKP